MVEIGREDIRRRPRWPIIVFGDGLMALEISSVADFDSEGEEVFKITLVPTPELAKEKDIALDMISANQTIVKTYKREYVGTLSSNPSHPVKMILCDFNGEEAEGTRFWKGKMEADKIIGLKKINRFRESENAYLNEQLGKAKKNIRRYFKEEVAGVASELNAQLLAQQTQTTTTPMRQQ